MLLLGGGGTEPQRWPEHRGDRDTAVGPGADGRGLEGLVLFDPADLDGRSRDTVIASSVRSRLTYLYLLLIRSEVFFSRSLVPYVFGLHIRRYNTIHYWPLLCDVLPFSNLQKHVSLGLTICMQ
jgi:hypothetical protein